MWLEPRRTVESLGTHHPHPSWLPSTVAVLGVLGTLFASVPASAQRLSQSLCPAGSSLNPNPTLQRFMGVGIPMLRKTIDTQAYPAYTQLNHITTPVFVRMDLDDPLAKDRYSQWQAFATPDDYWAAQFNQLTTVASFVPGVVGTPPLEAPAAVPGVHGPNCGKHVAIQTNPGFFRDRVVGPGVAGLSLHDQVFNWWVSGLGPGPTTQQIQFDNPGLPGWTSSLCF